MGKERLIWLDALKGFLILLVIVGHAIQYGLPEDECEHNYWWNLIYSFHMPAFMAASGFVNYHSADKPPMVGGVNLCKRRTYQLLIPFFAWSVIKWACSSSHTFQALYGVTFHNGGFFWFLWALWVITLLSIGCNWVAKNLKIRQEIAYSCVILFLVFCMIVFDIRIFGFQYIAYYFIFYALGYFLNKYKRIITDNRIILTICFFGWFVLASFWNMHELPWFLSCIPLIPSSVLQYSYRFLTAIIAVYFLLSVFSCLFKSRNSYTDLLTYLGRYSLAVYGLQGVMIGHICELAKNSSLFPSHLSVIMASFIATTILCLLLVNIGNRWTLVSRWLFGKI